MEGHNNVHCQSFAGFLFDMDGTIVDTTKAITKHWNAYVYDNPTYLCYSGLTTYVG